MYHSKDNIFKIIGKIFYIYYFSNMKKFKILCWFEFELDYLIFQIYLKPIVFIR